MRKILCYVLAFVIAFSISSFFAYQFYWKPVEVKVSNEAGLKIESATNTSETQAPKPQKIFDKNGEEIFWQGKSGEFNIRWTDKDIYVEKNDKIEKLFTNYANFLFRKNLPSLKNIRSYCIYSTMGSIHSVVGNIVTIEIDEMTSCPPEAHPSNGVYWIVFDLNNTSEIKFLNGIPYSLKLNDFFSDKEIVKAMLENKEIKSAIADISPNYKPKTSVELVKWFKRKDENWSYEKDSYVGDVADFGHKGQLNENSLRTFNFNRIEGEYVFVDIMLTTYQHLSSLELKLKIPAKLRENFALANSKEEGFLETLNKFTSKEFEIGKKNLPE